MIPSFEDRPSWLKGRGYLHITPKIDILKRYQEIWTKVHDENFVKNHGFFPLIHSVIKERKYKKHPDNPKSRGHSYKYKGEFKNNAKLRPLHYSTHIDSMIFAYYADIILKLYEIELEKYPGLSDCVTAYRKIALEEDSTEKELVGKSTAHFAREAFDEIKARAIGECVVLMFDIKSFFSELNHEKLKEAWCNLLDVKRLNAAHFNVFKATTDFRYILLNDLRIKSGRGNRKNGFDEKKLARIRKTTGTESFFESVEEFRETLKNKQLNVYKHPFVKDKVPIGIPQGLPISAVLANLYLLDFDKEVLNKVVHEYQGYYRRYSDDILVICKPEQAEKVEEFIMSSILKSGVKISPEKTEKYLFKQFRVSSTKSRITSILLLKSISIIGKPLTYLGFEFHGYKTLIKSSNLAKFYRRMINSVKTKAIRANKINGKSALTNPAIFRGRLKKKYQFVNLDKGKEFLKRKKLVKNEDGNYLIEFHDVERKYKTTYFSYVRRASKIMDEPGIELQIRNHKRIFNSAIAKHLNNNRNI